MRRTERYLSESGPFNDDTWECKGQLESKFLGFYQIYFTLHDLGRPVLKTVVYLQLAERSCGLLVMGTLSSLRRSS